MNSVLLAFLAGIMLSAVTVLADVFVKHASLKNEFSGWPELVVGALIYGATAFGWFFLMRKITLTQLGVLYGVSCIILLTLVSVFYFKERISLMEILGIFLGLASIALLARFS